MRPAETNPKEAQRLVDSINRQLNEPLSEITHEFLIDDRGATCADDCPAEPPHWTGTLSDFIFPSPLRQAIERIERWIRYTTSVAQAEDMRLIIEAVKNPDHKAAAKTLRLHLGDSLSEDVDYEFLAERALLAATGTEEQ